MRPALYSDGSVVIDTRTGEVVKVLQHFKKPVNKILRTKTVVTRKLTSNLP